MSGDSLEKRIGSTVQVSELSAFPAMRPAAAPLHADLPELLACGVTGRLQGPSGVRRSGVNSACRDFRKHGEGRQVVEREVGAKQDEPPKTESAPAEPADQEANKRFSLRRLARADSEFPSASAELLASVAHEVNQPLYAIGNYAKACVQVLQGDNPDVGTARQWLEKIAASAFRGHDILRRFRELASYQEPERTNVSILELIDNALEMLEFELSSARVEVQKTLVAPQLTIYADRTLIRQVLVNLCKNACEALHANPPIGRKLTIGVASSPASIGLFVADNGPGIADDVRDRLFEQFTTTKPNHSGVGLTICKMIGELHGGRIEVHSNPEGGATFTLVLPL